MDESYTLTAEVPAAEDYLRLRIVTGLDRHGARHPTAPSLNRSASREYGGIL